MDKSTAKKCPECLAEVPAEAKKCSHCGSKLPQKTSMLVKVLLGIIGGSFLISIISGLTMAPSSGVPSTPAQPTAYEKELSAEVYSETYIERLLKSPSTADFCSMNTTDLGDNRWRVKSCVDSQNSYGAMIRSNWETTMIYTEDPAGWEMEKVIFDGKVIYERD